MASKQREAIPDLLTCFEKYNQELGAIETTQTALNDVVRFFRNEVGVTGGQLKKEKEPGDSKDPEQNILRLELEAQRFGERLANYHADLDYTLTILKEAKVRILGE